MKDFIIFMGIFIVLTQIYTMVFVVKFVFSFLRARPKINILLPIEFVSGVIAGFVGGTGIRALSGLFKSDSDLVIFSMVPVLVIIILILLLYFITMKLATKMPKVVPDNCQRCLKDALGVESVCLLGFVLIYLLGA